MTVRIRCHRCHSWNELPDGEAWRAYAATGSLIQTLTERIVAQPIEHRYITPLPVMKAAAMILPIAFFSPGLTMYFHIDPLVSGGLVVTVASALFVWASSRIEVIEEAESQPEDEPEMRESQQAAPQPFIEVTHPGKNSLNIRVAHEPPANPNPTRQRTLGQADIALARLATGDSPIEPISLSAARKAGFRFGEPAFYDIQRKWIREGLAFKTDGGAVYLKAAGRNILAQYAQRTIN